MNSSLVIHFLFNILVQREINSYIPDTDPTCVSFCHGTFYKAVASYSRPRTELYLLGAAWYDPQPLPASVFLPADTLRKEDTLPRIAFSPSAIGCYSHAQRRSICRQYAVWHAGRSNDRSSIAGSQDACMVFEVFWA